MYFTEERGEVEGKCLRDIAISKNIFLGNTVYNLNSSMV
jgi:hypothetical protein